MRQIYKHTVIGLILASFTFTPVAFAKPRTVKMRKISKIPSHANMKKVIRSGRRGLKVSTLVESAKGMVKKREMRDIRKMTLPFWDKKFSKFTVGKDYFKIKFRGKTVFGRYVDRGPVAFMINNKPLLWKDFLVYGRAKARLFEIFTGKKKKARKVSSIDFILNSFFMAKAEARTPESKCEAFGGQMVSESRRANFNADEGTMELDPENGTLTLEPGCYCMSGLKANFDPKATIGEDNVDGQNGPNPYMLSTNPGNCPGAPAVVETPGTDTPQPAPPVNDDDMKTLFLIGFALLLLILISKRKPKPPTPEPPIPGWTPEGTCPQVGDRGMTEADLPPRCRTSSCDGPAETCVHESGGIVR